MGFPVACTKATGRGQAVSAIPFTTTCVAVASARILSVVLSEGEKEEEEEEASSFPRNR